MEIEQEIEKMICTKIDVLSKSYLKDLRDGVVSVYVFNTDMENHMKTRSVYDTAARSLAIAIYQCS